MYFYETVVSGIYNGNVAWLQQESFSTWQGNIELLGALGFRLQGLRFRAQGFTVPV